MDDWAKPTVTKINDLLQLSRAAEVWGTVGGLSRYAWVWVWRVKVKLGECDSPFSSWHSHSRKEWGWVWSLILWYDCYKNLAHFQLHSYRNWMDSVSSLSFWIRWLSHFTSFWILIISVQDPFLPLGKHWFLVLQRVPDANSKWMYYCVGIAQ